MARLEGIREDAGGTPVCLGILLDLEYGTDM